MRLIDKEISILIRKERKERRRSTSKRKAYHKQVQQGKPRIVVGRQKAR